MYVLEKMDFNGVRTKINPTYFSSLEFLESLEVARNLLDEPPLAFQFGELIQSWRLQVVNTNNCDFTIICNKKDQKIDIECLTTHNNLRQLGVKNQEELIDYFHSKYGIEINKFNSSIVDDAIRFKFFCYLEFDTIPTIEQISHIYKDLFLVKKGAN